MEKRTLNRMIYEAILHHGRIKTSKVSMFDIEDIFRHPPFFRFRFLNINKEDEIYESLRLCIFEFKGKVEWKLTTDSSSENYIIFPVLLGLNGEDKFLLNKQYYQEIMGTKLYEVKVRNSLADIPFLAEAIAECKSFSRN